MRCKEPTGPTNPPSSTTQLRQMAPLRNTPKNTRPTKTKRKKHTKTQYLKKTNIYIYILKKKKKKKLPGLEQAGRVAAEAGDPRHPRDQGNEHDDDVAAIHLPRTEDPLLVFDGFVVFFDGFVEGFWRFLVVLIVDFVRWFCGEFLDTFSGCWWFFKLGFSGF